MKVGSVRGGKLLPALRAVIRHVDPAAAERQTGAADFLAEISFACARVHDVGTSRIDEQRVDRDVRQAIARGVPVRAAVVTPPDTSRHARSEQRRRHGRVKFHDARAAADVAGPKRRPRIEHAGCLAGVAQQHHAANRTATVVTPVEPRECRARWQMRIARATQPAAWPLHKAGACRAGDRWADGVPDRCAPPHPGRRSAASWCRGVPVAAGASPAGCRSPASWHRGGCGLWPDFDVMDVCLGVRASVPTRRRSPPVPARIGSTCSFQDACSAAP